MFWWNGEEGKLHQVSTSCRIDMEYLNENFGKSNIARLLLTTLTNPWRSLIRFDVGDLVEIDTTGACPVDVTMAIFSGRFRGASANLTYSVNGLPVTTASVRRSIAGCSEVAWISGFSSRRADMMSVLCPPKILPYPSLQQEKVREQNWRTLPALSQQR